MASKKIIIVSLSICCLSQGASAARQGICPYIPAIETKIEKLDFGVTGSTKFLSAKITLEGLPKIECFYENVSFFADLPSNNCNFNEKPHELVCSTSRTGCVIYCN